MSQTALITGASGGLGLEFAKIFSREGYDLLIIARREGILYKLKSELESQYRNHVEVFACDLSKADAAYEVFNYTLEKNIQIDVLVNNAAFCAGPKMSLYYASKEFVRSFSEAVAEETEGTGVSVTALCPGPTATGFEKAAEMKDSKMFTFFRPADAKAVAETGYKAMMKNKILLYYGASTKLMNIGARILPRSISRKFAGKING